MLSAKEIYSGTFTFVLMKFGLGMVTFAISVFLGAFLGLLTWLLSGTSASGFFAIIAIAIWTGVTEAARFFLMHYVGYLVKAGHVAIVAQAVTTGKIPDNQFNVAKEIIKKRFVTANVYFALDKLVGGAVKQLGRTFEGAASLLMIDRLPGFQQAKKLVQFFLEVALGYVDECCLAWTILHDQQSPFKSAADAVVIYFQNWKTLLKTAAKTVAISLIVLVILTLIGALPAFLLIKFAQIGGGLFSLGALVMAIYFARAVKDAFLDSWTMVAMVSKYMEIAPETELKVDLYGKLCGLSTKFKELFEKGQKESEASSSNELNASNDAPENSQM